MAKIHAADAESIARDTVARIGNGLDAANVRNAEMGIPVWDWKSEDGWRHVELMREILGLSEAEYLASTFATLQLKCEALAYRERIKAKAYLAAISTNTGTLAALGSSNAERLPLVDTRSSSTAGGATRAEQRGLILPTLRVTPRKTTSRILKPNRATTLRCLTGRFRQTGFVGIASNPTKV